MTQTARLRDARPARRLDRGDKRAITARTSLALSAESIASDGLYTNACSQHALMQASVMLPFVLGGPRVSLV
jgi:hypothetical protein